MTIEAVVDDQNHLTLLSPVSIPAGRRVTLELISELSEDEARLSESLVDLKAGRTVGSEAVHRELRDRLTRTD